MRHRFAFALIAVSSLALTACSGLTLPSRESQPTPEVNEPAATTASEPPELEEVREYWPLAESYDYRVPNLVGMHLPEAREALEEWDAFVKEVDASEEDRDIWMEGNWTVVSQDPLPGPPQSDHERVELAVLKNDEAADEVAATLNDDTHVGERVFSGVVTGYGASQTILVDSAEIHLDLITPVMDSCGLDMSGVDAPTAYPTQVAELLPIGTEVLAVRSDERGNEGFLHIRSADQPWPTPPLESANELLVRSGWWEPYVSDFEGGFLPPSNSAGVVFEPFAGKSNLTPVQAEYAPLIANAGNVAVSGAVAAVGKCRAVAERDAAAWAVAREETDRRIREMEIEIQRRTDIGYYNCRDGDGDGVCYER